MSSKTVLITGATSGIGKITAIELAKKGMQIVFTSRGKEKGEMVKQEIISESKNSNVEFFECDLASFESIKNFANEFKSKYSKLDILINNAGVWETERKETKDGIEMIFGVNHLAPFLLTNLLLPTIKQTPKARIINVSSNLHSGEINFEDIEGKNNYSWRKAYNQSKLANILFTKKLAKDLKETGVTVNCLHPGFIKTDLFRNQPSFVRWFMNFFQITPFEGAQTTIYLATSDEIKDVTGEYFSKSKIEDSGEYSNKPEIADKLWKVSLEYVGKYL